VILGCVSEIRLPTRVHRGLGKLRGGVAMQYRFSHLGADCQLLRRHEFEADTDTTALEVARQIFKLSGSPQHSFELWQDRRRIFIHNC
jgi:hypothetical protein